MPWFRLSGISATACGSELSQLWIHRKFCSGLFQRFEIHLYCMMRWQRGAWPFSPLDHRRLGMQLQVQHDCDVSLPDSSWLLWSSCMSKGHCCTSCIINMMEQTRNQVGRRGGEDPLENFSPPLEKFVGYIFKLLDIVQKIWAPLRKLFAPTGVPSWLRACDGDTCMFQSDLWFLLCTGCFHTVIFSTHRLLYFLFYNIAAKS